MPLIKASITAQNFDIMWYYVTFFDSSIDISDARMNVNDCSLLRAENKRGGVCKFYKTYLLVIRRTELSNLHEYLVSEITAAKEKCF